MVPIKRRSFLQGIAATVFGGIAAFKGRQVGLDHLEGEKALSRYGETPIDPSWNHPVRPADGKYLDATEVKCLKCYRWIPIPKGFYAPGDEIECDCGNRALFVLNAKVELE